MNIFSLTDFKSSPLRHLTVFSTVGFVLLGLVGCTVGPDYRRPLVNGQLPTAFDAPPGWKLATPADKEKLATWWDCFGDKRLDDLMKRVEAENQEMIAALHRVEQARAISQAANSAAFPGISFDPSATRGRRSGTVSDTSSNLTGRTTTNLTLPLNLGYEIDFWGKIRRGTEAAKAETEADEALRRQLQLTLQSELAVQYFGMRSLDAEIELFEAEVELRRKALELNQKRFEAGDTDEVDVSRAETEMSATETELIGLRQNRSEFENAIAVLIGKPSSGFRIAPSPLGFAPPRIPVSVPSELLERRPDIAAAERIMIAENARIGVAKAAFFPSVSFNGSIGLESGSTSQLFDYASRTWGLGPEISFPVFEGGLNKAELARSEARYDETVANYRQTILQAVREVDDALVAVDRLSQRFASQQRTVSAAARTVELSQQRYDAGVVAYFEVVDAQRTELSARQAAVRLRAAQYLASIALVKALGGGWE